MKLLVLVSLVGAALVVGRGAMTLDNAPSADGGAAGTGRTDAGKPRSFVTSVTITREPEGTVYSVRPTRAGRLAGPAQLRTAWRQAVARGVPDDAGLKQQFLCHPMSVIARAKPTWDLEAWRPTVGGIRTMLAACNP